MFSSVGLVFLLWLCNTETMLICFWCHGLHQACVTMVTSPYRPLLAGWHITRCMQLTIYPTFKICTDKSRNTLWWKACMQILVCRFWIIHQSKPDSSRCHHVTSANLPTSIKHINMTWSFQSFLFMSSAITSFSPDHVFAVHSPTVTFCNFKVWPDSIMCVAALLSVLLSFWVNSWSFEEENDTDLPCI